MTISFCLFLKVEKAVFNTSTIAALATGENSELDTLLTSGNKQAAFQLVSSLGSLLNSQSESEAGEEPSETKEEEAEERKQVRDDTFYCLIKCSKELPLTARQGTSKLHS